MVRNIKRWVTIMAIAASVALVCSSQAGVIMPGQSIEGQPGAGVHVGSRQRVRPAVVAVSTFHETETTLYFTGEFIGGPDQAIALRLAKAEAIKGLLEATGIKARSEFSTAMQAISASSQVERHVTDAVAWTVENLSVSGIKQRSAQYERTWDPASQSFKYNAWVRIEISKTDYLRARLGAARHLLQTVTQKRDHGTEEAARRMLKELHEGL